jgi:hypothetical protein
MQIKYTGHIKDRLSLRKIDYNLPRKVFEQAEGRYFDEETGRLIATMHTKIYDKTREVMVAYIIEGDVVKLLTIHPIKEGQKGNNLAF